MKIGLNYEKQPNRVIRKWYLFFVFYLIALGCSYEQRGEHAANNMLLGVWSEDSIIIKGKKVKCNHTYRITFEKDSSYKTYFPIYDDVLSTDEGRFFINKNNKRPYLTLSLVPNAYKKGKDLVVPIVKNIDVEILNDTQFVAVYFDQDKTINGIDTLVESKVFYKKISLIK